MLTKLNELIKNTRIKHYFVVGSCQLIIAIAVLWCYDSFYKQKIGVVNITGIVEEFIKRESQNNTTSEALKATVRVFGLTLEKGLNDLGRRNRVVLLSAEAVITGAKDYTPAIQHYVAKLVPKLPPQAAQKFKELPVPPPLAPVNPLIEQSQPQELQQSKELVMPLTPVNLAPVQKQQDMSTAVNRQH